MDNGKITNEAALIFGNDNTYALYQIKNSDDLRDYRYTSFEHLQDNGISIERNNYVIFFHGALREYVTPERMYNNFKADHPLYFTGLVLGVSDVIVMQCNGVITSHFVDEHGFKAIPDFLGNECNLERNDVLLDQRMSDFLQERISNHFSVSFLTKAEERLLQDNIDTLGDKLLAISSLYVYGMTPDAEKYTIDRLIREELEKSREGRTPFEIADTSKELQHRPKVSLLGELNERKDDVAKRDSARAVSSPPTRKHSGQEQRD
jgi:hypothetical protein